MKKYMLFVLISINFSLFGQTINDYRSSPANNAGDWDLFNSWEIYTNFFGILPLSWYTPLFNGAPRTSNTNTTNAITIRNGDVITLTDTRSIYNLSIKPTGALIINQGYSLTVLNDLDIDGKIVNHGTLILNQFIKLKGHYTGDGDVVFMGTSHQTLGSLNCNNLIINNPAGVSINGSVNIEGKLTLTNGNLFLDTGTLTLGNSASISGSFGSSNMIVASNNGILRKNFGGTGSFTFPIGDSSGTFDYSPTTINFTSGNFSNGIVSVNVKNQKQPNNSSINNYLTRYWTISQTGISNFSADVTFNYVDDDIVGTEADIYTGQYHNSNWTLLNAANPSLNQLNGVINTFSDFTGGEQNAFPVELTSFNANVKDASVMLSWTTATEINNYGFDVERSLSQLSQGDRAWTKISFVKGNGNSNSPKKYSFTDKNINSGKYSYRLKQIDLDGSSKYSNEVEATITTPDKFGLDQNYPNPFNPTTTIKYDLPKSSIVKLVIYNSIGMEIAKLVDEKQAEGTHTVTWKANDFPSGIYFYKLQVSDFVQTRKMLLLK